MCTRATCKTKGVVYLIECRKCQKQYVDSTKNALHIYLNGHRHDIKQKKSQKFAVAKHFNRRWPSMEDLTIMVIEKISAGDVQTQRVKNMNGNELGHSVLWLLVEHIAH